MNIIPKTVPLADYEISVNLVPGAVFLASVHLFFGWDAWLHEDLLVRWVLVYFVGLVSGRVGAHCVEWVFARFGFVSIGPYDRYVEASSRDRALANLQRVANMYRSLTAVFLCLLVATIGAVITGIRCLTQSAPWGAGFLLLFILFATSYARQMKFVSTRVSAHAPLTPGHVFSENSERDKSRGGRPLD